MEDPRARDRLFTQLRNAHVASPVFLTGDWHATFVNDPQARPCAAGRPDLATEIVTPAITTGGDATPYGPYDGPRIPHDPHIRSFEGDRRGYVLATLRAGHLRLDLRFAERVSDPDARTETAKSFVVDDRVPGARAI
ncbi:MAG: alkaline phosphatase D family protein [Polyangiales bacterium]